MAAQAVLDAVQRTAQAADRAEFDAQVSTRDPGFAGRADVWFANLQALSRAGRLELRALPRTTDLGTGRADLLGAQAWVQRVVVSWRPNGSRERAEVPIWLTFAAQADRARLAGDADAPPADRSAPRPSWLTERVRLERREQVIVVGSGSGGRRWLYRGHAALRAVRARLRGPGARWSGPLVIEVPSSRATFERSLGVAGGSYARIGAVAWPRGEDSATAAVDVIVNPQVVAGLSPPGVAVLLAHEVTHVLTRSVESAAPTWLTEGFADYVAYAAYPATQAAASAPLQARVRQGWLPRALPSEADFRASGVALDLAYAQAWSLCRFLADRYGAVRLERFYESVGAGTTVAVALQAEFGLSTEKLIRAWRADLRGLAAT